MKRADRVESRRKLDNKLNLCRNFSRLLPPPRGWVKAIRESLGMTTSQLGQKLNLTQARVVAIEQAEVKGSITLNSLEKTANALGCDLFYVLVPARTLEETVRLRAEKKAKQQIRLAHHTMALEGQTITSEEEKEQYNELVLHLIKIGGSILWEDENEKEF